MNRFTKKLLTKLIDKYERSVLSKGGSSRNLNIEIKISDPVFEKYNADDSYLYVDVIEQELNSLKSKQLINIKRRNDGNITSVSLNLNNVNDSYRYLNREAPREKANDMLEVCYNYLHLPNPLGAFCSFLIRKIKKYESIQSYCNDADELKTLLFTIDYMMGLEEDVLKRQLSVELFKDSKYFEKVENKVCKIIRDFDNVDFEDNVSILESYHVHKNPTFVYIKGNIVIKINRQIIDLSAYGFEISLSSNALKSLEIIELRAKKILTIENLTSFISFNDNDYICIYLAGYHNQIKRDLIHKINNFGQDLQFFHFGDIDAGGFNILIDLINKTNINFLPFKMDIYTLITYKDQWNALTNNDIKRLKLLKKSKYSDVIEFMLKNKCKLEQENIK